MRLTSAVAIPRLISPGSTNRTSQFCDAGCLSRGAEADNRAVLFRDIGAALGQAFWSQDQVFRVSEQVVTVARIR